MKALDPGLPVRIISGEDAHYFFGYYDLQPHDVSEQRHLCHRVAFCDRLPAADDPAQLGYIDLHSGAFTAFAQTTAWNFQQGAMLQWNPARPQDEVIYNVRRGEGFGAVVHNIATGAVRPVERALAAVAQDGRFALSINFNRLYDFRPGYGYAGAPDPWADCPQPQDDGIYLIDMGSGRSRLLVSYAQIQAQFPHAQADAKLVVNHITFNPSGDRFIFLVRNFAAPALPWATALLTSDRQGNLHRILDYTLVSHYHWKNDRQILVYARVRGQTGLYLLDDLQDKVRRISAPCFEHDLHCLYSPDRRYILGDAYPDAQGMRPLYLFDSYTGAWGTLLDSPSPQVACTDIRCDLHARWNRSGNAISFDAVQGGRRVICQANVPEWVQPWG